MGWQISFLGLNQAPDFDKLNSISWLKNWRLFQEPETEAWLLEGQGQSDTITFFEEIKTSNLVLKDAQSALLKKIETELARNDGRWYFFDSYTAKIALLLSIELGQPVASFIGDDEGTDAAFIFDQGKLVTGQLQFEWNKALSFGPDAKAELEWLYPEGLSDEDEKFKPTRHMYQIALENAQAFFGSNFLDATLDFDRDDLDRYLLKAEKGVVKPPYRSKSDVLRDDLGTSPSPKQLIERFEPIIHAILDPSFPDAPNEHRFEMDKQVSGSVGYTSNLRCSASPHLKFYADLSKVLGEISRYTMALRPKPDFRKRSINFKSWNRELNGKWRKQKRRADGKSGWFFT